MPWTGLFFLVGAMAISGLPPLNGFASEWLTFQAFLFGFRVSAEPLVHFLFPVGGALLALTTALAAACFVKAFGITFLALPRSQAAADAHESPAVMLVPQAFLAALCVGLGLFPGVVLRVLGGVHGVAARPAAAGGPGAGGVGDGVRRLEPFDHVVPVVLGAALLGGLALAAALAARPGVARAARADVGVWRRADGADGVHGDGLFEAADDDLPARCIGRRGRWRRWRTSRRISRRRCATTRRSSRRSSGTSTARCCAQCCAWRDGMKVLQAGSLHAYLAYVIALVVSLVLLVWWRS